MTNECNGGGSIGPRALELLATGDARLQVKKPLANYVATLHIGQVIYRGVAKTVQAALNNLERDIKALDDQIPPTYLSGDVERKETEQ